MIGPRQYRKKPVLVEAMQNTELLARRRIVQWILKSSEGPNRYSAIAQEGGMGVLLIDTLEGRMTAMVGDWVVRGVKGEFYPVKPEIFNATYEEVT